MKPARGIRPFFIFLAALFSVITVTAWAQEQPNVLFIILDTLRSDHLGCYGYKNIETPAIDNLARRGTLFKNVISEAPLTFPAHVSIFTSTYPQFHKARDNGNYRLADYSVTLAERLKEKKYLTAAVVSSFVLDKKFGLDRGFDSYDDRMPRNTQKRVIKFMDEERTADETSAAAIKWLQANRDKKFFLWVHYYDPHTVYNPPSPYKERYKDNLYDGEIAFADKQIGILLSVVEELKLDENLLIVFASDHGEGLGEHKESGHGIFLYDATLKVPLIFSYPGEIPEGKIVEEQVRLVDIMPTLLDLLRIKKNKEIQGVSLVSLIRGEGKAVSLPAYSESLYARFHFNWSELQSWRTGEWKYIKSSEPELYDIKNDPRELVNVAGNKAEIIQKLDEELESFLKKTASAAKEKKISPDAETKEKLMSLGYIQGSAAAGKDPVPLKMVEIMEKLNLADRMANEGLLDEAIEEFNKILKLDPDNIEANLHLAQCYKESGRYNEAIKHFKKAASFKPDDAEVHNGLGNIYKSMGRTEEAFSEFKLALAQDPKDPAVINNIGWYYQQKSEFDKAMEQYRKVLEIDDKIATTHANMGIIYRVEQLLDKAIEELNIAIGLDPELAFAYSELGACFAVKGDLEKAIGYCRKAVELDPEGFDGYNNLGVCYERGGEFAKALESYKKARAIAPWNPLVYYNMGNAYLGLKEFDKARACFKKTLEINPDYIKAANMLRRLNNTVKETGRQIEINR